MGSSSSKASACEGTSSPVGVPSCEAASVPAPSSSCMPCLTPDASQLLCAQEVRRLCDQLPATARTAWHRVYSTEEHGRSFNRFLVHAVNCGPSLVVIKERNGATFGGYASCDWRLLHDRYEEARDDRASLARAQRNGVSLAAPVRTPRPANQHVAFYGNDDCFVFRVGDGASQELAEREVSVYRARPTMNANFQYLFDTHALEDRIGVGMGGAVGHHAWFLNRHMEHGHCKGVRCTTFGNPRLSNDEEFEIDAVEVWALDAEVVDQLRNEINSRMGAPKHGSTKGSGVNVLDDKAREADKELLRLNGKDFYSDTL